MTDKDLSVVLTFGNGFVNILPRVWHFFHADFKQGA